MYQVQQGTHSSSWFMCCGVTAGVVSSRPATAVLPPFEPCGAATELTGSAVSSRVSSGDATVACPVLSVNINIPEMTPCTAPRTARHNIRCLYILHVGHKVKRSGRESKRGVVIQLQRAVLFLHRCYLGCKCCGQYDTSLTHKDCV